MKTLLGALAVAMVLGAATAAPASAACWNTPYGIHCSHWHHWHHWHHWRGW